MGENKPTHIAQIVHPDRTVTVLKVTTKQWKAWKALEGLKYSDFPEGTIFQIVSSPPKKLGLKLGDLPNYVVGGKSPTPEG